MIEKISYSYMVINSRKFSRRVLVDCDFSNTILNNCDFSGARLINCNFSGAELNNCNFDGAKIRESEFAFTIRRKAVRNRLAYCKISNCTFRNAVILYTDFWCGAYNTDFSGAKIGKCNFIDSDMANNSFVSCTINHICADDTDFGNSDFSSCTIENYNFGNCRFTSGKTPEISCQELMSKAS